MTLRGAAAELLYFLYGNGQRPIKNISDAIITLAACEMNQIVSVGLTNDLVFNFASTIGAVCAIFDYFLPFRIKLILPKKSEGDA